MERRVKVKGKALIILTFIYIYVPIVIFLFGFTKIWIAILTIAATAPFVVRMVNDFIQSEVSRDTVEISYLIFFAVIVIIIALCLMLGIGGIYPQAGDWFKHNAVLRDLTLKKWPVFYESNESCMLTYYLGQYLFPALIGKLFDSFEVSNLMLCSYSIYGLIIVYLYLIRIVNANNWKKQLITLLVMFFFCGALTLCQTVIRAVYEDEMFSEGSYHWVLIRDIMLQYRSNLIMIRWVLPQIVVSWIVVLVFMENIQKVEYYVALILPVILFGSFSLATLAVMALCMAIVQLLKHDITINKIFSLSNILPAISLGLVLFFYFLGNIQTNKPYNSSFRWQTYSNGAIGVYLIFCLFMFGIYSICVYKENKNNPLFYINVAILLFLPWCKMGLCNDIVMSGSIPSLFILMIYVLRLLFDDGESTSLGIRKGIVIVFLFIGALYPLRELHDNVAANGKGMDMGDGYYSMEYFTDRSNNDLQEDLVYNYYTYDMDGKTFYEYISRKKAK